MSLIVARKEGKQLAIVSDTRLTYPDDENKREKNNPTDGSIKIIIINPNLCVSFAGEVDYAEAAFKELNSNCSFNETIEILNRYHQLSSFKTEFLVCCGSPQPIIYKIKNNESKVVESSWIGSQDAFNRFQESFLGTKKDKIESKKSTETSNANIVISEMNVNIETNMQVNLFSKMSSAMDDVIEDGNITSVGGFKVNIVFEEKFDYTKYVKFYRGNVELYGSGQHVLGHGSAAEGAYSVSFFGVSSDFKSVGLHLKQGNFGVIYNRIDNGLFRPLILKLDEVDFSDHVKEHFNLSAIFSTQERVQKFIMDGKACFDKTNFVDAITCFEKALSAAEGKRKAECLFYKGISLWNLRKQPEAMHVFQETINIDSSYQQRISKLLFGKIMIRFPN